MRLYVLVVQILGEFLSFIVYYPSVCPDQRHPFQYHVNPLPSLKIISNKRIHYRIDISIAKLDSLPQDPFELSSGFLGDSPAGPVLHRDDLLHTIQPEMGDFTA